MPERPSSPSPAAPAPGPAGGAVPGEPARYDPGMPAEPAAPRRRAPLFHVALDELGQILFAPGSELALGHARSEQADLRLLADLLPLHARLELRAGFASGQRWELRASRGAPLRIAGQEIGELPRALRDHDEIELASGALLRFRSPDAASASALLELMRGLECEGAWRVLLFAPEEAGRVRIGAAASCHLRSPIDLEPLEFCWRAGTLEIVCARGLWSEGVPQGTCVHFPLVAGLRRLFTLGRAQPGRPPRCLSIEALFPPAGAQP